jgi:hypothetical protein
MFDDVEIDWHLCRHTRTGKLSLLGVAEINSPVLAQLLHVDDDDWRTKEPAFSGGGVWIVHCIEELGDSGREWMSYVADELEDEIRRLESLGILPKERPVAY